MSFLQPEIIVGTWYVIDGTQGVESFPAMYVSREEAESYYSGEVWEVTEKRAYGARLSAPGYMDCTEWTLFATHTEAETFLKEEMSDTDD